MKPNDFLTQPWDSVLQKTEAEIVARNIMAILFRTDNEFRPLTWDEYKAERLKDGDFSFTEQKYFNQVVGYCISAENAISFSPNWRKEHEQDPGLP